MRSPNFGPRRDGLRPELVVLHYTAMECCEAALRRLCDPVRKVSAHYLISETGTIHALVGEDMRAWHAGAGAWRGAGDVNSRSIGIELANSGAVPFAARQIDALEHLLGGILSRWHIPPWGVIGHSDMAPGRKPDPGPRFDWRRLALCGLSVWPAAASAMAAAPDGPRFRAAATRFGYPDTDTALLLQVVRARFCPWRTGALGPDDMGVILDLAARFGIDPATKAP